MKGIADTGFLVAFANRGDAHHDWAVALAGDFRVYRRNKRETIPLICPPDA